MRCSTNSPNGSARRWECAEAVFEVKEGLVEDLAEIAARVGQPVLVGSQGSAECCAGDGLP